MSHGVQGRATIEKVDIRTAQAIAQAMHALATPSRVMILAQLREAPSAVSDLARAVQMENSAVSHQLRILRHMGLVAAQREGRRMIYQLHDKHVGVLLAEALQHVHHLRLGAVARLSPEPEPEPEGMPVAVGDSA
jgi:ArsR family transcriptional regulator, nickel/cobalt-responsive transcriptional repressor